MLPVVCGANLCSAVRCLAIKTRPGISVGTATLAQQMNVDSDVRLREVRMLVNTESLLAGNAAVIQLRYTLQLAVDCRGKSGGDGLQVRSQWRLLV